MKNNILHRISEDVLDARLKQNIADGKIDGEQWFRNPLGWLLVSFNNPLNYKNPNGELVALQNNKQGIQSCIKGYNQIHYGVGVGETELELVRFELEQSGVVNLEAIDINETFIKLFNENLKYKELEYGEGNVDATLYVDLFQNYQSTFENSTVHIVLGGTLGNFDNQSEEMWEILKKNSAKGDLVLLGVKLNSSVDVDLQKYVDNQYYPTFVLAHLDSVDRDLISWSKDGDYIRMFYKGDDVFRTRRVDKDELKLEAEKWNFEYVNSWDCEYKHASVLLLRKM